MRRFRLGAIFLALALSIAAVSPVAGQGTVRVFVDGDQVIFDQPPIVVGSRVLVPMRGIFEKMGATVVWIPSTSTVRAQRGTTSVELRIGSRNAVVNGQPVTLDVPAQIVGGRTLVPLRFISESLGAGVEYDPAARTVTITTGTAGQPPAPPGQTTIKGVVTAVSPGGDQPTVTVESGSIAYRIRVTPDTIVTRVDASTGSGGSVSLASLRRGDDAEVTMSGNTATRIRATYLTATGRIEAIARASRTLVLSDGRSFRYVSDVAVLVNDKPAAKGIDALVVGQVVELRLNPTTREAWEINVVAGAAQPPVPSGITLEIARPAPNDVVSSPVRVSGTTASRAQVVVSIIFQGTVISSRTTTADAAGRFDTILEFPIRARNATYVVNVRASHPSLGSIVKRVYVTVR